MKCKNCQGEEFYGHQVVRVEVIVDAYNAVLRTSEDDWESSIYDCETPYGPYRCVSCNTPHTMFGE